MESYRMFLIFRLVGSSNYRFDFFKYSNVFEYLIILVNIFKKNILIHIRDTRCQE